MGWARLVQATSGRVEDHAVVQLSSRMCFCQPLYRWKCRRFCCDLEWRVLEWGRIRGPICHFSTCMSIEVVVHRNGWGESLVGVARESLVFPGSDRKGQRVYRALVSDDHILYGRRRDNERSLRRRIIVVETPSDRFRSQQLTGGILRL